MIVSEQLIFLGALFARGVGGRYTIGAVLPWSQLFTSLFLPTGCLGKKTISDIKGFFLDAFYITIVQAI